MHPTNPTNRQVRRHRNLAHLVEERATEQVAASATASPGIRVEDKDALFASDSRASTGVLLLRFAELTWSVSERTFTSLRKSLVNMTVERINRAESGRLVDASLVFAMQGPEGTSLPVA